MKTLIMFIFFIVLFSSFSFLTAENTTMIYSYGSPISNLIYQDQILYFTSIHGFVKFNLSTNEATYDNSDIYLSKNIVNICVDSQERFWFVSKSDSSEILLNLLDNGLTTVFHTGKYESSYNEYKIFRDSSDLIWITTQSQGILCFDMYTEAFGLYNNENTGIDLSGINEIMQDAQDNSIWIATKTNGLLHFQNNSWTMTTTIDSVDISQINSIAQSPNGIFWIGNNNGLYKIIDGTCERINQLINVKNLFAHQNILFFQSTNYHFDYLNIDDFIVRGTYISNVTGITASPYYIYVGTQNSLAYYFYNSNFQNSFRLYPGNLNTPLIQLFTTSKNDNSVWIKSYNSIFKLHNGEWTEFNSDNIGLNIFDITDIAMDYDNNFWAFQLSSSYTRFIKFDGQNWTIFSSLNDYSIISLTSLCFDHNNRPWMIANGKLAYFENNQINYISGIYTTIRSELSIDNQNNIWFATPQGIICYKQETNHLYNYLNNPSINQVVALTPNNIYYSTNICLYHQDEHILHTYEFYPNYNFSIDKQNNVWALSNTNLKKLVNNQFHLVDIPYYSNYWNDPFSNSISINSYNNKYILANSHFIVYNEDNVVANDNISISLPASHITNFPNPFNPSTTIEYNLQNNEENLVLSIYNIKGQLVKTLFKGNQTAGKHQISWDGKNEENNSISSGIYFMRLQYHNKTDIHKMLLMK